MKLKNNKNLEAIIKWAGGKESELKYIIPNSPKHIDGYYEPFVGGGSVFVSFNANKYYINDKSEELINLYNSIKNKDVNFYDWIDEIVLSWKAMHNFVFLKSKIKEKYVKYRNDKILEEDFSKYIENLITEYKTEFDKIISKKILWKRKNLLVEMKRNLINKTKRMKKLEKEKGLLTDEDIEKNIETAFLSALYMYYRNLYNDVNILKNEKALATALFVFIRNYSYSGMFRYNDKGEFNVPYGGIAYNSKTMDKKISYYKSQELNEKFLKTNIYCLDFEEFLKKTNPQKNDFVFLDPPYDTEFSTYAKNEFGKCDQERLAQCLINNCKARWMLVIKNTPFIYSLYNKKGLNITSFDKNYTVSFMNRNNKAVEHLLIRNYK